MEIEDFHSDWNACYSSVWVFRESGHKWHVCWVHGGPCDMITFSLRVFFQTSTRFQKCRFFCLRFFTCGDSERMSDSSLWDLSGATPLPVTATCSHQLTGPIFVFLFWGVYHPVNAMKLSALNRRHRVSDFDAQLGASQRGQMSFWAKTNHTTW